MCHEILIRKLLFMGIAKDLVYWIEDYLCNRRQQVNVNGICSTPQRITYGVPQASVLGPLLFSLYINDLPATIQDSVTIMYADNTVILANNENAFHQDLLALTNWCIK